MGKGDGEQADYEIYKRKGQDVKERLVAEGEKESKVKEREEEET